MPNPNPNIDDDLNGRDYEKQFANGGDPDDSDTPGANQTGDDNDDGLTPPAARPPAPAPAPAAPAPAPAPAAPAPAPAAPAAAPVADPGAAAPAPADAPAVEYRAEVVEVQRAAPADAEAQIEAAATKRDAAYEQLLSGEIESADYKKIERETNALELDLRGKMARDEAVDAVRQESANRMWADIKTTAVNDLQKIGIPATPENLKALDEHIADFSAVAQRRGMDDGANLTASRWVMEKAAAAMRAEKGVATTAAPAAAAAPAAKPVQTPADRKVDRSTLPPTLATAPLAADAAAPGGDRFAHIDAMSERDQERAIAAMKPAEERAYLER